MKRWVNPLLFAIVLSILPSFASAEITTPYTVDFKPRVILGDSDIITSPDHTYYGLENYKQEYVNGYARFYFSYTHSGGSYSSYPPRIYITDGDPRVSTTTQVKYDQEIHTLKTYWAGFGDPTDWYTYEVQFDPTGFTTTVKRQDTELYFTEHIDIENFSNGDFAAIANRYPLYNPNINEYSMSFEPVRVSTFPTEQKLNPVIIIPGIMGSANKDGVWLIDPILHTYDDLIETLAANGYQKEKNLFTFPYEWRDSNVETAKLLKTKITDVIQKCEASNLSDTDCSKVDLVAHSMGGLVAREYAQSSQYRRDIDQLIFLGTPHKGSQKAYLQWEAGKFPPGFEGYIAEQFFVSEAKRNGYESIYDYIRNRPIRSVQELLPIFDYLEDYNTGILRTYPENYPRNTFLEILNSDILNLLYSGIKITNIVGNSGNNTIDNIRVVQTSDNKKWEHGEEKEFKFAIGDDTVTAYSSRLDSTITDEEYIGVAHDELPRETSARVFNILTNKIATDVIYLSPVEKIFSVQLQSPIDVVITAPDGRRVGKNFATGQEYNEIPGAFYTGFNNDVEEYITIPNPVDGKYIIEVQGTDNGGEYGVLTGLISEATSTTNQIVGITKPNQITQLTVDINGQAVTPAERVITLEVFKNDINGAYDLGWVKDKKTRDAIIKQVEGAIKLQKRIETIYEKLPNGKRKEKKIEKIELSINKTLLKLFDKELELLQRKDKITKEALDLLKLDIKYLLNNN